DPENRTDFKYPRLLQHLRQHRAELLTAGFTILRAFIFAGRPAPTGKAFGSFEEWSDFIRGAVLWATGAAPLDARDGLYGANDRDDVAELFRTLPDVPNIRDGLTCRQILAFARAAINDTAGQNLREFLQHWAPPHKDLPSEAGLGKRLA